MIQVQDLEERHAQVRHCEVKTQRYEDRTARQTQVGIGHSAPAHRGGHRTEGMRQVCGCKAHGHGQAVSPCAACIRDGFLLPCLYCMPICYRERETKQVCSEIPIYHHW